MGVGEWWERDDLRYMNGRLQFAGVNLQDFAAARGTPCFVYSGSRVRDNLLRLKSALAAEGLEHRVFYALKANRFAPLLGAMRSWKLCGIDACSPGEVLYALQQGFAEEDISFTGNSVSNADIEVLARHPGVHVNCDSLSTLRRLGDRAPGRSIGIRINPRVGAGLTERSQYSGAKPTKFGVYRDRFEEALEIAAARGLKITQIHFHFAYCYIDHDLPRLDEALSNALWFIECCPEVDTLDVGGGMGAMLAPDRPALDLAKWAAVIARHTRPRGLKIHLEPGDYLVKDAGALLCEVNTVEAKGGVNFAGTNAGFNLSNLWAYYQTPFVVAPLALRADAADVEYTLTGNINEAIDILAENVRLPELQEGDLVALLNAGGYGSSASSNHCMRGVFQEHLLD